MASNWIFLSRPLKNKMPCYNGKEDISITQQLDEGSKVTSMNLSTGNHVGTHVDFPLHFYYGGKSLSEYLASYFVFENILIWDIPLDEGVCLSSKHFAKLPVCEADLLLLRTMYGRYYGLPKYWQDNPGLSADAAMYIKKNIPCLRAIGVDFLSVNAYNHKADGREAHKILLDEPEILIIEDLDLENLTEIPKKIIAAPMLIENADGAYCTVMAEL